MHNPRMPQGPSDTGDDAPNLMLSPWREKLDAAPIRMGRPIRDRPKISTTIRLDQDVIEALLPWVRVGTASQNLACAAGA
ncbi:hypothetical protein ACSV9I_07705 [Rhizobium sp. G187]|uniref:hypothetical protein n=1 Tax=Rhizobium sp. G187 TaxID=3451352 RepID=UPI003EE7316D